MKTDPSETRFCEKEEAVAAGLRSGSLSGDLLAHISVCEVCAEVAQVSHALLQEVAPTTEDLRLPDASLVWRRAQALAQQHAIAKATRPIRIARICAGLAAFVALPWLAPTFLNSTPTLTHRLWTMNRAFSDALTGTTMLGVVGSLILISLSSWYVLRQE